MAGGFRAQPFTGPETSGGKCSRLTGTQVEDLGGPEVALGAPDFLQALTRPALLGEAVGRARQEPWLCSQPFSKGLGEKLHRRKTLRETGRVEVSAGTGPGG